MARHKKIQNRDDAWIDLKSCQTLAKWTGKRIGFGPLLKVKYRVLRTKNGSIILEGPDSLSNSSFILWHTFFPHTVYREYSVPEVLALMFETGRSGKKAARRAFPAEAENWAQFIASHKAGAEL